MTVSVPALSASYGYYYSFTSQGSGAISATWTVGRIKGGLYLYSGNPFSGQPNPTSTNHPGGSLASDTGNKTNFNLASAGLAAGTYAVYFHNNDNSSTTASSGTVSYVKSGCP